MQTLEPSDYPGETLCPRCGRGEETGNRYRICAEGVPHYSSCFIYRYGYKLCSPCEAVMRKESSS